VRYGKKPFKNTDKIISTVEFNQRLSNGEELCIFNDYIIDVKKFKPNHPGGRFVI
jgi:cytochrome b involved in lipid metabolism